MKTSVLNRTKRIATTLNISLDKVDLDFYEIVAARHKLTQMEIPFFITLEERIAKDHPTYRTRDIRGLAVIGARVARIDGGDIRAALDKQILDNRHKLAIDFDVAQKATTTLPNYINLMKKA